MGSSSVPSAVDAALARMSISSPTDVMDLLNCQSCAEPMYPPIYQCFNGHATCSNCKHRENFCHSCLESTRFIRCLPFEQLASKLILNCRYYDMGCSETFPYTWKSDHEQLCKFRPFSCPDPISNCAFTGSVPEILGHLKNYHKLKCYESSRIKVKCPLRLVTPYGFCARDLDIYKCWNQHFCFHFEAIDMPRDRVYMVYLTFLGDESDAKFYRYRLEVTNGAKKMAWLGVPRSIREVGQGVIRGDGIGLIIHSRVAKLFSAASGDGDVEELVVNGRIWKEP